MVDLPSWHPMSNFDFVQAIKIYPGGRKQERIVHVTEVVGVDEAIRLLEQGSAVYILPIALFYLEQRWHPPKRETE